MRSSQENKSLWVYILISIAFILYCWIVLPILALQVKQAGRIGKKIIIIMAAQSEGRVMCRKWGDFTRLMNFDKNSADRFFSLSHAPQARDLGGNQRDGHMSETNLLFSKFFNIFELLCFEENLAREIEGNSIGRQVCSRASKLVIKCHRKGSVMSIDRQL